MPRYFATPEAAIRFAQAQQVSKPQYGLGGVKTGKLRQSAQDWSGMTIDPAPVGPDGSIEFCATASGYEWGAAQWGRAKLSKNSEGR